MIKFDKIPNAVEYLNKMRPNVNFTQLAIWTGIRQGYIDNKIDKKGNIKVKMQDVHNYYITLMKDTPETSIKKHMVETQPLKLIFGPEEEELTLNNINSSDIESPMTEAEVEAYEIFKTLDNND